MCGGAGCYAVRALGRPHAEGTIVDALLDDLLPPLTLTPD